MPIHTTSAFTVVTDACSKARRPPMNRNRANPPSASQSMTLICAGAVPSATSGWATG